MLLIWLRLFFAVVGAGTIHGQVTVKKKDGTDKQDYSEVVVYVADAAPSGAGPPAEIRQRARKFVPQVIAVPAGTEVNFPNDDKVEHNVFSHSAAADFDLGRFSKGPGKAQKFSKVGVAEIFCNAHKDMVAYVVVAPSGAFAVTGADGKFEIEGVAPGKHKVMIWERFAKPRFQEATVVVPKGGDAEMHIEVAEKLDADPPHMNKLGLDYYAPQPPQK